MTEPIAVPYTARCDGCPDDALWTTVVLAGRNVTTVHCERCGTAEFHGATVVPLPAGPSPAAYPTARAWGRVTA